MRGEDIRDAALKRGIEGQEKRISVPMGLTGSKSSFRLCFSELNTVDWRGLWAVWLCGGKGGVAGYL